MNYSHCILWVGFLCFAWHSLILVCDRHAFILPTRLAPQRTQMQGWLLYESLMALSMR